jgi:hypothetical protein
MTARERITTLTNSWYGFAVFGLLYSILTNGIGVISLVFTAFSFLLSLGLTFFFGRRLLARSSFTRLFLLVVATLGCVFAPVTAVMAGWQFIHEWSFSLILSGAYAVASTIMSFRSFRALTDAKVKAYIAG